MVGGLLTILPLCGANGLAFVPANVVWLGGLGIALARSGGPGDRRRAAIALTGAVAATVLTVVYFVGYERPAASEAAPAVGAVVRTAPPSSSPWGSGRSPGRTGRWRPVCWSGSRWW